MRPQFNGVNKRDAPRPTCLMGQSGEAGDLPAPLLAVACPASKASGKPPRPFGHPAAFFDDGGDREI